MATLPRILFAVVPLSFLIAGCGDQRKAPSTEAQSEPDPQQSYVLDRAGRAPVIAVHAENIGWNSGLWLRLAVWQDGVVIWSTDFVKGGEPYLKSKIAESIVAETAARMREEIDAAALESPMSFGVHATNSQMRIWTDGRYVELATFHEQVRPDEIQLGETERVWDLLWSVARSILPATGVQCSSDEVELRLVLPRNQ
jgi:hypothetical protein